MTTPFSLNNKTVLVTGASSGIGRATAIECAKMGANVVITGRNADRLRETYNSLEGKGHLYITADLGEINNIGAFVEQLPYLDGVVHCAGIMQTVPFPFVNQQKLDDTLTINFISPTLLSQALVKSKKIGKGTSIVFVSSISGVVIGSAGNSIYSASKGAVNGMVKGMAIDLALKKIRVNSVNPGMIETAIYDNGSISQEQLNKDAEKYPLGRYGKPQEVAYAVIYLLSDASSWTTGTNLLIDGGYTLL